MLDFGLDAVVVIVGAFVLFMAALKWDAPVIPSRHWILGLLACAAMLGHRVLGHGVTLPFYTVLLFAFTISGMIEKGRSLKPVILPIVIGTALGWLAFAQVLPA